MLMFQKRSKSGEFESNKHVRGQIERIEILLLRKLRFSYYDNVYYHKSLNPDYKALAILRYNFPAMQQQQAFHSAMAHAISVFNKK